jgi:acetyl esterase/lipase
MLRDCDAELRCGQFDYSQYVLCAGSFNGRIPCNIPTPRRVSFPMVPALKSSLWSCCSALLAVTVCIPGPIKAETAELPGIKLWPNGAPGQKGDTAWDMPRVEAYAAPKDKANGGAVLVCPGGGYGGLAADHEGKQVAQFFNSFGVTAFVLSYRLGSHGYHHPIELNDAKRGMRWIRTNAAQYGIDPQRIGVIGFSAGGHLASTLATLFDDGVANLTDQDYKTGWGVVVL